MRRSHFSPPRAAAPSLPKQRDSPAPSAPTYMPLSLARMYVGDKNPHTVAAERGITAIGVEIGEGGRLDEADVDIGVRGLLNALKHMGMLAGEPESFGRQLVIRTMDVTRASRGGILHLHVKLNDDIDQGQHVASVINPFGEVVEQIHTRSSGPVVRIATAPIVSSGERVVQVGVRR